MELVSSLSQIEQNLDYLERAHGSRDHKDLVKRGTCFLAYNGEHGLGFAPSRFTGYIDNDFGKHAANKTKDGRETNPAISAVLRSEPEPDPELESAYRDYCRDLGFDPNPAGSFGVERKYWDLRKRK